MVNTAVNMNHNRMIVVQGVMILQILMMAMFVSVIRGW